MKEKVEKKEEEEEEKEEEEGSNDLAAFSVSSGSCTCITGLFALQRDSRCKNSSSHIRSVAEEEEGGG